MSFKIYTKTGDKGQTSLLGGVRVDKNHIRIEAYGTVDELNAFIGLLRDQPVPQEDINCLLEIQDRLFTIGSMLAAPSGSKVKIPGLQPADVTMLELEMDRMNENLPEMKTFVLPGGNQVVSFTHIARCVCRRAERHVIGLNLQEPVDELIVIYLNRLSDYLFVLSRKWTFFLAASEVPWKPRLEH